MRTLLNISLYGKWTAAGRLHIRALTDANERLSARELKLLLFADDPDSFYGAQIDVWTGEMAEGVSLGPEEALSFFAHPPVNPLVAITWDDGLDDLRKYAASVRGAVRSGHILPSYRHWLEGKLHWTAEPEHDPALSDVLETSEPVRQWVHFLMEEESRKHRRLGEAIDRLLGWKGPRPAERDWLHLTGWLGEALPFRAALRLMEPADPRQAHGWELAFVLIGREADQPTLVCDAAGRPANPAPEAWKPWLDRADAVFKLWLEAVPEIAARTDPPLLKSRLNDAEAWLFLTEYSKRLSDSGGLVVLPAWWDRLRAGRPRLKADLRVNERDGEPAIFGIDQMIRFDWKLSIGDVDLTEEEYRAIARDHKRLHYVRGKWIWLDDALAGHIRKMMERSRSKSGMTLKEVLHHQFGGISPAAEPAAPSAATAPQVDWEMTIGPRLLHWMKQLTRRTDIPLFAAPASFRGSLRGYQSEGVAWLLHLRRFGFGACLADDMGLGKTIQYIAYLLKVKELEPDAGPSLLVCPTSLIGNWQKELERFSPGLRVYLHYGGGRLKNAERFSAAVSDRDLVLTTYMTALLDFTELCGVHWNSLCLDEAQNIKNAAAKQSAAIRKIPAAHRIAMTGTPMENRQSELWSIFDFINPGYLGGYGQFRKRLAHAPERPNQHAAAQIRRLIRPFMLRRMKSDPRIVPDLPDKMEAKIYVPLTREQAALYESVLDNLLRGINRRSRLGRRGAILAALTRLKQICDHPALYIRQRRATLPSVAESHKAARLVEMVRELRGDGDRCLVFTQFAEMGAMLQRLLEHELKEPVLYLYGGTPKFERDRMVAAFQEGHPHARGEDTGGAKPEKPGSPGVFVLSLKAGGTGLNLTAASHVFHYDRWWNPAVENQATDRAYRIGQHRHVQVHKFITLGTLEERIDELIEKKTGLSRQLTGTGEEWLTELSADELHDLLTLRREWLEA